MEKNKYDQSEKELKEQYHISEAHKQEERYCPDIEAMKEKYKKFIVVGLTIIFSIPAVGTILIWIAYAVNMLMSNAEELSNIENYIPLFASIGWIVLLVIFLTGIKAIIKSRRRATCK